MTHYSSGGGYNHLEVLLAGLERCSFFNGSDGCRTVQIGCVECGQTFYEELEAAKEKVTGGFDLVCLACDDAADKWAFTGITVQIGWE